MKKRKNTYLFVFTLILITVLLTACKGNTFNNIAGGTSVPIATSVPAPEAGKTTLTGRVLSTSGTPYNQMPVRLAAIYRQGDQGAYVLDMARSPGAFTDQNGYFVISNIDPVEYTIVVGNPDAKYVVIADKNNNAKTWKPDAGKILDVGTLNVNLDQ